MDKEEYFPRKRLFEETQDLVASFYSTGNYISEESASYSSMLIEEGCRDDFYYCLYLLSMLSTTKTILNQIQHIVNGLNPFRLKKKNVSTEEFIGEIDIENFIQRNYIDKTFPKEYPSIIKFSTFQSPEYQLTLLIIRKTSGIYREIFRQLGKNEKVTAFKISQEYCNALKGFELKLHQRYGVSYSNRETYTFLKKKVMYRYRNRKLLDPCFKLLIQSYEKMIQFKGIDFEASTTIDLLEHYPNFDDRLYEIWLIRKSSDMLADAMGIDKKSLTYTPLFKARKEDKPIVQLANTSYNVEIWFQNRKNLMPKDKLKWFFWDENGEQEEIGAIPDLIFIKHPRGIQETTHEKQIVLVDAKNRTWTLEHMEPIKKEIVQQIYILNNFIELFKNGYSSMLIAHNIEKLQTRIFHHKDNNNYEIDMISIDMKNDNELQLSLNKYISDLKKYLCIV